MIERGFCFPLPVGYQLLLFQASWISELERSTRLSLWGKKAKERLAESQFVLS